MLVKPAPVTGECLSSQHSKTAEQESEQRSNNKGYRHLAISPEQSRAGCHFHTDCNEETMPILDVATLLPSNKENKQCRVCGGAADGVYFGALVCLPCKSFFIRCTKDGDPVDLKCQGARSACFPSDGGRIKCQRCRYAKCLEVGMARRSEKPEVVMPPVGKTLCAVCGDIANGLHFGVMTCEGCKKFFRRSLTEASTYTCKRGQEDCPVNPRTRNECRLCRYRKCLQVGMSREAIKVGRPPVVGKKDARHHPYSDAASSRGSLFGELSHLQVEGLPEQYAHSYQHQPLSSAAQSQVPGDVAAASEPNIDFNYLLHYFHSSSSSQQQQQQLPQQQPDLGADLESVLAELSDSCQYDGLFPSELDTENQKPSASTSGHAASAYDQQVLSLSQNRSLLSDVWLQYLLGDDERLPEAWDDRRQGGVESRASLQRVEGVIAGLDHRPDAGVLAEAAGQPEAALVPLTFHENADWIDDVGTVVRTDSSSETRGADVLSSSMKQPVDYADVSRGEQQTKKNKDETTRSRKQQDLKPEFVAQIDRSAATPMDHRTLLSELKQTWRRALRTLRPPEEQEQRSKNSSAANKEDSHNPGAVSDSHVMKAKSPPADAWRLLNELAIRSTAAWLLYFQSLAGTSKLSQDDKRALICSAAFGNTVLATVSRRMHGDNGLHWFILDCKRATQSSGLSSWQAFHRRLERCAEAVQKARPDESECAVLCAIMFMSTGATLKDKVFVERERLALTDLLRAHIKDTIGDGKDSEASRSSRLTQLLQLLPMLQHLTLWHRHLMRGKRPQQNDEQGALPPTLTVANRTKPAVAAHAVAATATRLSKAVPPLPNIGEIQSQKPPLAR